MKNLTLSVLLLIAVLFAGSARLSAATTVEYDEQINVLLRTVNCLEGRLAALVGEEQARQARNNCLGAPTNIGSGLMVSSPAQPTPSIVPLGAARLPFTRVTFTAPADGRVAVNGLVVKRVGMSVDAVLDEIMLLDEAGLQIGFSGYLNANHQTVLPSPFIVEAGQSRTFTIAANRPSWWGTAAHAGMVVGLALVKVNTQATVSGALPIVGAQHTVNEGLAIGAVALTRGVSDPGQNATWPIGTTIFTFSAIRITAGAAEPVVLRAIRWYQSGSAAPTDLANVQVSVDGVPYPTTVSADGKYYTAIFGDDIVIDSGFSKEVKIGGELVGGAGRTVDFDIERRSDLYLEGYEYGLGIMPPFGSAAIPDSGSFSSTNDPWYDAAEVVIDYESIAVSVNSAVTNQNIVANVANQPLGGFTVVVAGGPVSVRRIGFNVAFGNVGPAVDVDDIVNAVLVDEDGVVVAGPVDGMETDSNQTMGAADGSVIFTDAVVFPVGVHSYTLKGKLRIDIPHNATIQVSTTPAYDFAIVRGLTTGMALTPFPAASINLATMTVKRAALRVSLDPAFTGKTVIAGARQTVVNRVLLDATQSGEDVRVTTLPLGYSTSGAATDLTNCQLYDSAVGVSVTSRPNVVNPTGTGEFTFTFDGTGIIVPKGTVKALDLRVDISSSGTVTLASFSWGIVVPADYRGAFGLQSAQTTPVWFIESRGAIMQIIRHGSAVASLDQLSPTVLSPAQTNALVMKFDIVAAHEQFAVREVVVESQMLLDNIWKPLVWYLGSLSGKGFQREALAIPFPEGSQNGTAGRLHFLLRETVVVPIGAAVPFELRVDATGLQDGAKARFTVVEIAGVGVESGASYFSQVAGVVSEVTVVSPQVRIESLERFADDSVEPMLEFIEIQADGSAGALYDLQDSADLKEWTPVNFMNRKAAGPDGRVSFRFWSRREARKFFRVVTAP